jgi:nucleotide-binding universal stress UspA family protein
MPRRSGRRVRTFRTIVLPLDGSRFAEHALPVAAAVARAARARLRLVLVHQLPPPPSDRESAKLYVSIELAVRKSQRDYLRAVAARLRDRFGIQVTTLVPDGPIGPTLAGWIHDIDADLVVMTTHGRSALGRALLGSIADHVVRTVHVPVILVRPAEAPPARDSGWSPGEILVPLDGSPLAEAALIPAGELARIFEIPLSLVQVVQPLAVATDPPLAFPTGYDERITGVRRREAQDYLESLAGSLREQGLAVTAAAVLGTSPAGALLDMSQERSRLIAIATRGRGGAGRMVLGSVTDKLIRGGQGPVLVVPPKGRRAWRTT